MGSLMVPKMWTVTKGFAKLYNWKVSDLYESSNCYLDWMSE